jgi:hypothetical protein
VEADAVIAATGDGRTMRKPRCSSCGASAESPGDRIPNEGLSESTVLSYSEAGRTRFLMLPPDTVGAVRTATDRYRAEKARLEERANQGLDALVATLAPPRRRS